MNIMKMFGDLNNWVKNLIRQYIWHSMPDPSVSPVAELPDFPPPKK